MKYLLTVILLMTIVFASDAQDDWESVEIKTVKITDNIYMLQGRGGNIGVITGEDGVMIIDDQYAQLANKIKAAIKKLSDKPVKYVVNTHYHGDHMGGNEEFASEGSIIVAHENVRTRVSTDQFMAFQQRNIPTRPEAAWPVVTFSENITFYFNDEEIMIHHGPPAHTDGDAFIYFKTSNVLHMGDAFVRYGYPFVDMGAGGSVAGMIENIDQAIAAINDDTKVIPGHGELATRQDMINFSTVLKDIKDRVWKEIEDGKSLDEILSSGITKRYDEDWEGNFIKSKDFITFTYEDLVKK